MKELFCSYEQSLALKELGFDEPCLAWYQNNTLRIDVNANQSIKFHENLGRFKGCFLAPLKSQVFKWFRDKHDLHPSFGLFCSTKEDKNFDYEIINHDQTISVGVDGFNTYEEAEDACIDELIELVKNK